MPLISYIYSASKQISAAISPGKNNYNLCHEEFVSYSSTFRLDYWLKLFTDKSSHAFKEVAIIRHPRIGEYAFGFITSSVLLRRNGIDEEVCCVYVPTNHLYLGDIFLINSKDIMRPNLSVREGIGNKLIYHIYATLFLKKYTAESVREDVLEYPECFFPALCCSPI